MNYLAYAKTPVQEIVDKKLDAAGIRLLVKREDLNHPTVSGNKWWKLKYNLLEAIETHAGKVITFGGAYSNHIYATAAATSLLNIPSVGIIRGEETSPLNQTLAFARSSGMALRYISREAYRSKNSIDFIDALKSDYSDSYIIPEGGTNLLAVKGCAEFYNELNALYFDLLVLCVGTAGTMTGIIAGCKGQKRIIGVPVLKNGDFLSSEMIELLKKYDDSVRPDFELLTDYHFGGYAKVNPELIGFIREMKHLHNLPLDPVYTGKLLYAIYSEIKKGSFARGTTILALHTGGLQGAPSIMNSFEPASR
jgi:1-aminocyclopropane-1-carboxylate deaminase